MNARIPQPEVQDSDFGAFEAAVAERPVNKARAVAHYSDLARQAQTLSVVDDVFSALSGITAAFSGGIPRPVQRQIEDILRDEARDNTLANIAWVGDWLFGQSRPGSHAVTSEWESRSVERLQAAHPHVVLHALLVAGQSGDADLAVMAAKILGDLYLQDAADEVEAEFQRLSRTDE